ncbi:MAG: hypothetical protein ACXWDN_17755, partial [Limisphaerales bacterium]
MKARALTCWSSLCLTVLMAANASGTSAQESFFDSETLPPPNAIYTEWAAGPRHYDDVKVTFIMNERLSKFSVSVTPPNPGDPPQTNSFVARFDCDMSTDGGNTYQPVSCDGRGIVVTKPGTGGTTAGIYDTEILQLNLSGGSMPNGMMIRESPTLQSTGQTTVRSVVFGGGSPTGSFGNYIDSFFDVFTELSLDGGGTWTPASEASVMELVGSDPDLVVPVTGSTSLFPAPTSGFVAVPDRARNRLVFVSGSVGTSSKTIVQSVRCKLFSLDTSLDLSAISTSTTAGFDTEMEMEISTDDGNTFQKTSAPAHVTITVSPCGANAPTINARLFQTEMLQMDVSGLPGGVMIRESPTLASFGVSKRNAITATQQNEAAAMRIGSFFDVFLELSTDGGQTWIPASGPLHLELQSVGPEQPVVSLNFPPTTGALVGDPNAQTPHNNGRVIRNMRDRINDLENAFTASASTSVTCLSTVDLDLSLDGGQTFTPVSAQATSTIDVTLHSSVAYSTGLFRVYDTEMTSFTVTGGSLP